MAKKLQDLTGQRFSHLVVQHKEEPKTTYHTHWICLCDCGQFTSVDNGSLKLGRIKSCGCFQGSVTHGYKRNRQILPEYQAWLDAKKRCGNPKSQDYHNYGGRGIQVCPEWLHDFPAFFEHVGLRPSVCHTLDRINCDGNYQPGNVRWATRSEQALNRRDPQGGLAKWNASKKH